MDTSRADDLAGASAASPFAAALEAALKPLRFAAAGDFARADRVHGLEKTMVGVAVRIRDLAVPAEAKRPFEELARMFASPLEREARAPPLRRWGWGSPRGLKNNIAVGGQMG